MGETFRRYSYFNYGTREGGRWPVVHLHRGELQLQQGRNHCACTIVACAPTPQEFILSSGMFDPAPAMRQLHFHFLMFGRFLNAGGSLRLETLSSSGWTQLWSRSGQQGKEWGLALVSLPQDARAVRFIGTTGDGARSDIALDAIATGLPWLPTAEFRQLSCDFSFDTCLWQNTGVASWQLAVGQGNDDGPLLEATWNGTQGEPMLQTSVLFNTTEEKALVVDYQLSGSDSVVLEVQCQTSAGDWQRLLSETGGRSSVWHSAIVTIPASTVGLRLLANITSEADVVRIDTVHAANILPDWRGIACDFESDFCAWSTGVNPWFPRSGSTPSSSTGPSRAAEGEWYIFTEASDNANKEFILTSDLFDTSPATRQLRFNFHMLGADMGSLRFETLRSSGWTQLWSRSGEQGTEWRLEVVSLPQDARAVRFVGTTGNDWKSDIALDAIAPELPTMEFRQVSCDFSFDTCLWKNAGAADWQLAAGPGHQNGQWLEAAQNGYQASEWILETAREFNTTEEKDLVFDYQMSGSDSTLALEVQHRTSAGNWQRLFLKTDDQGNVWHTAIVSIPAASVGLRFVANVTKENDTVRIDTLLDPPVLSDFREVSCDFESNYCAWFNGVKTWSPRSGSTPSEGTGPSRAAEGDWYIYTEASPASSNSNEEFILSSGVFDLSPATRQLHFNFHMLGADMGSLRLETLHSSGWTQLWSRSGEQGTDWGLAVVSLPQDARAVRFVGTTGDGWASDIALDAIATGLPTVEFRQLSCNFSFDTCLWKNAGAADWQLAAGQGHQNGQWLEATQNGYQASEWILETACEFNTTEEKALVFDYQMSGSDTLALELQHRTSASDWQRLFLKTDDQGNVWHTAIVSIPAASVGLRFVANVTKENDTVRIDTLHDQPVLSDFTVAGLEDISCNFEHTSCLWTGGWKRHSGPTPSSYGDFTGPKAAFRGDMYVYTEGHDVEIGQAKGFLGEDVIFTSPRFPKTANTSYLEFAYHMYGSGIGLLELQYLQERERRWTTRWSRQGSQGRTWLQAKVTLPSGVEMLRFVSSAENYEADAAVDSVVAWSPQEPVPEFLSLCSGGFHNCAVLTSTGQLKCWGGSSYGKLGSGAENDVGNAPNQMGAALPAVELPEPSQVMQVACGYRNTCVVLHTGALHCFGDNGYGQLGLGHSNSIGDEPGEMGNQLPPVDLGSGVQVLQLAMSVSHSCALLKGGTIKCFGDGWLLGLGDTTNRGDDPDEMGSALPTVDLGMDFEAVQLAAGTYHTCALSSQGKIKCWGWGAYLGLGLSGGWVGTGPQEMGENLPFLDLGPLPAQQIATKWESTCAVLADGSVRCWGLNDKGQLGNAGTEFAGDDPGEMGAALPVTELGDGVVVQQIASGNDHTCAILQDASLKCWGWGVHGQLGQGTSENLGDEPSELGSNLHAVDFGNHEVRAVSAGYAHTCVLLDDDSTRCFGFGAYGSLGQGSSLSIGATQGQMGAALAVTELFVVTLGTGLEGLSLSGDSQSILQVQHEGVVGLICDDGFDSTVAQVACRDLGMAGGVALTANVHTGIILADNVRCTGAEVSLRDCSFRGWHLHDCTQQEAAGVQCQLDAWSEYTAPGSPPARQDAAMIWDDETETALVFAGHASAAFHYYTDLWRYDWPQRRWTEILVPSMDPKPKTRSGHAAIWDGESKSMFIMAGKYLSTFYEDMWQFSTLDSKWRQLGALVKPRAYHTAVLNPTERTLLLFGGEGSGQVRSDLLLFSLADVEGQWSESSAPRPAPRSRHTAVWAEAARIMLVYAGWDGQQYLQDLQCYDASADQWTEIPVAAGWPAARGGHAACWDPVAESLMIVGGIQNVSNTLSYSAALYNYSLLTGTWREEGLQVQGPAGRTGHAMVWDNESRALLLFGGYNSSYLQQTWRYAASHTSSPDVVSCQLGRICSLNFSDVSGALAPKHTCSDSDFLTAEPFSIFQGAATLLFFEPGHHRLCWCNANCTQPDDFVVALSFLSVQGPYLDQSAECQLGATCLIKAWRGVGLSVNDSINMKSRCTDGHNATYPDQRISISFNTSYSSYDLHVGFLDPENILPQDVQLCWCPASSPCNLEEDFLVVALRLRIACPPGEYGNGFGSACMLCPENSFCPGDIALNNCPYASTSPAGSSQRSDCLCLQGRYWSAESGACLACPAGSSTSQVGATSLSSCTCTPGFANTEGICEACGMGFFCTGGSEMRRPCDSSQTTQGTTATSVHECVCKHGFFFEDGLCAPCPLGYFKPNIGNGECSKCGDGTFSNSTGAAEPCKCAPGYGFDDTSDRCMLCPVGEYKPIVGNIQCSRCASDKSSAEGSTSPLDCRCRAGLAAEGSFCRECVVGFFCPGTGEELRCPDSATSGAGSSLQTDCICTPGYFLTSGKCEACPPGRYKPTLANDLTCPLQCPTNALSAYASTSLADCFCTRGYFAELDSADSLARCASCALLPHLQCLGGFGTQAGLHRLPVSGPGYFQTGITTAVKCSVVSASGLSTCLGGSICEDEPSDSECVGKYKNACNEGSTGMLCGECPAGWSRSAFQQPCQPCAAGAALPLILSILVEVGIKALFNFVVASMAATAAARRSTKLHTILIRQATQWLAACSVLATFDLTQIPLDAEIAEFAENNNQLFPWPAQVTAAMLALFETFTLKPVLTSVDLAAQCFAQEVSAHSAAPRIAMAVYQLVLPMLVMLTVLLLSLAVVHVLVPLGQHLGHPFNKLERRAKALNSLRKALNQVLNVASEAPTLWADLERSGVLRQLQTQQIQQAAQDPDFFLRRAAAGSRLLLLRACTARACSLASPKALQAKQHLPQVDLSAFLNLDFASESPDFTTMLDIVLETAWATAPQQQHCGITIDGEEIVELETEIHQGNGSEISELEAAAYPEIAAMQPSTEDVVPYEEQQQTLSQSGLSLMTDEDVDSLNFGLFSPEPSFSKLAYQSVPIMWISLLAMWPGLLSSFLRMIWCIPILEDDEVVSRLLPNPSVICWSDDHMASARLAIVGLGLWCFGIPVTLAARLICLRDRQAPENFRRYGFFFQGLEPRFWWWDLLVKRLDVAIMMLVTYTSFVLDPKAKLMLFPVLSGFQVFLAAWVRPYANDQAEILDVVEVTLSMIRFLLFSTVASLLILQPPANTTYPVAYMLFAVLLLACGYFTAHFAAQVLRDVAVDSSPVLAHSKFSKVSGALKSFILKLALPLFTEAESDSLQLSWSFASEKITVTTPTSGSRQVRLASFQTAAKKSRTKVWRSLSQLSKKVLRLGPEFQQAAISKANEEFARLLLQLGQEELSPLRHACALATALKALPPSLVKSRIRDVWMQQLKVLAQQDERLTCRPVDLEQAVQQLIPMPAEDAVALIQYVSHLCEEKARHYEEL
ncbi:unnamed protein product [Symbiodinium sp. CCMP2592]|nr:unnamed protein product [Symbiodinium sp. CCMP2592]